MNYQTLKNLVVLALITNLCQAKPIITSTKEAHDIETMTELRDVLSSKQPTVIMFYAPWCGACKSMKSTLNTIAARFHNQARIVKINVDNEKCKEAIDFFGVEAIPTFVFKNVGVMEEAQLEAALNSFLGREVPKKKEHPRPTPKPAGKKPAAAKKPVKLKKASQKK